jgi:hypothetical protein
MLDQRIGVSSGKGMKPFGSSMALSTTSSTLGHCGRRMQYCISVKVSGLMTVSGTMTTLETNFRTDLGWSKIKYPIRQLN